MLKESRPQQPFVRPAAGGQAMADAAEKPTETPLLGSFPTLPQSLLAGFLRGGECQVLSATR